MSTPKNAALATVALVLVAAALPAAHAEDAAADRSVVLHYDATSAATERGGRDLYRRIVMASEQVCPAMDQSSQIPAPGVRQCRQQAIERALGKVHLQSLVEIAARSRHG